MKHWGESFSQGVRIFRIIDFDGREQCLSLRASGSSGWSATHLESGGESTDVKLGRRELRIGGDPACDVVLADPSVAPQHCRIHEHGGELMVRDRGFGVLINGERCLEPTRLSDGDRIEIGSSMIELLRGRSQLDLAKVTRFIHHRAAAWSQGEDERWFALYEKLELEARVWLERGRPGRRLLRSDRIDEAIEIENHVEFAPLVSDFLAASVTRCRRRQTLLSISVGGATGLFCSWVALASPLAARNTESAERGAAQAERLEAGRAPSSFAAGSSEDEVPGPSACNEVHHKVIAIDTVESLARDYGVLRSDIRHESELGVDGRLEVGATVRLCSMVPEIKRHKEVYSIHPGDTWEHVAAKFEENKVFLREQTGVDVLEPGQRLEFWARRRRVKESRAKPLDVHVGKDAQAVGAPTTGRLSGELRLESDGFFEVRCLINAYVSTATYKSLYVALSQMRAKYRYDGQLVVGDISRDGGGSYGKHLSHQTGRDVDVWLPIEGGVYRTGPECGACGTPWCRPDETEIDWEAAWQLVESLLEGGTVERIFLDKRLMEPLIAGAVRTGADESAVRVLVRRRKAFVIDAANHRHHFHVRFRCGENEEKCVGR